MQLRRGCHDTLPWLISFSLDGMSKRTRDALILGGIMILTFAVLQRFSLVLVYVVFVVGGLLLLLPLFERTRIRSRWALSLFAISSVLLIAMGAVKLLWHYALWTPSRALQQGLPHTIDFVA